MKKKMGYENSLADKKADKAGAKKAGMSVKKFENSPMDRKADKAAMSRFGKGKR